MKNFKNFKDFSLTEAVKSRAEDWPTDWKDLPHWKFLELLGFVDQTPERMAKDGNIRIFNPYFPEFPKGMTLQKSGYIRNAARTSGWVKRWDSGTFSLMDLFEYIIQRFGKTLLEKIPAQRIDQFFIEFPHLISFLEKTPVLKKQVLDRTGIEDFSSLSELIRKGSFLMK